MSEEKLKQYWAMYTDAWHLFRRFQSLNSQEDAFWNDLMEQAKALNKKHNSALFQDMILATINEIEKCKRTDIPL